MYRSELVISTRAKAQFQSLCQHYEDSMTPAKMPFVTFFEDTDACVNLRKNARVACQVLAAEQLYLESISLDKDQLGRFEVTKHVKKVYYNTGLHLATCLYALMEIQDLLKLNVKEDEPAYSDLVKFYGAWYSVPILQRQDTVRLEDTICAHRDAFHTYLTRN